MTSEGVEPGTVRPGGRTARVRESVLRAAGDALVEHGFDGLDLADVARRAGVGKTTVYRRWSTTTGLIADLLDDMAEQSSPRTDTGSLIEDLRANAQLVVKTLTDPRQGPLFTSVIAAATDPDEVIRAVSAPLYYRLLASGAPLDVAAADLAAEAAAAAARAGVYVR
jgi:AcrR family transcriptional regulator